jgi:hypothetical protein
MKQKGGKGFAARNQIFLVTLLDMYCLLLNSFNFFIWQYVCVVEREGEGTGRKRGAKLTMSSKTVRLKPMEEYRKQRSYCCSNPCRSHFSQRKHSKDTNLLIYLFYNRNRAVTNSTHLRKDD